MSTEVGLDQSHWNELNNHLKDGRIEIDNNLVENAIRPFALGRKNWLFNGSPAGAKAGAAVYSHMIIVKVDWLHVYLAPAFIKIAISIIPLQK